jgi:hypothetical protein
MGLVMKLWTNSGDWFYGGGDLSRVKVRRARFRLYRYGIFLEFQTNPYCWDCMAGLTPDNSADFLVSHSIYNKYNKWNNLFLALRERGAGDEQIKKQNRDRQ